jgi:pimeloyl-ACP methyl ester carboxylesterase
VLARRLFWVARVGAAVLAAATLLDVLSSFVYRTDTQPSVAVVGPRQGSARRVLVILPGFLMPGSAVGKAFAPYIEADDAIIAVNYAERGVDPATIYGQVRRELDRLKPRQILIYGASMGGLVALDLAGRYHQDGQPFGRPVLVLDTAPTAEADLRRPGWLFSFSCIYRGGIVSSVAWALGASLAGHPTPEADANVALVNTAHRQGNWMGTAAATSQTCYIHRLTLPGSARGVAAKVILLQAESAQDDPLVRVPEAIWHWRAVFPELEVVTIHSREGRWHVPIVERPRETVATLMALYQ